MAQVMGGNTKSLSARLIEIVGWWPALLALVVAGGASLLDANHVLDMPDWMGAPMDICRRIWPI